MHTIRTFIALPLISEVESELARLIQRIKTDGDGVRWIPTDNIHLTLKFLGEVDNFEIPKICDVIRGVVAEIEPFELEFAGVAAMPSLDRPRVIHGCVEDSSGSLVEMVEQLELSLAELGFKREPRDYRPHITIGRTKGSRRKAADRMMDRIKEFSDVPIGSMTADNVQLVGSFLDKHGPTYNVMDTIEF